MQATKNPANSAWKAFLTLPKDYTGLCRRLLPRKIHDRAEYDEATGLVQVKALYDDEFTADQRDYFDLLCDLVEDHDQGHDDWPKVSGVQMLKHLLDEREMTWADLSRILGDSRDLGTIILRGDCRLTVDHIRSLAELFKVEPSVLLQKSARPWADSPSSRHLGVNKRLLVLADLDEMEEEREATVGVRWMCKRPWARWKGVKWRSYPPSAMRVGGGQSVLIVRMEPGLKGELIQQDGELGVRIVTEEPGRMTPVHKAVRSADGT